MQTLQWAFTDRKGWGDGPWDAEVCDKIQWQDPLTGLPCLAKRGPVGSWCGYIGVTPGHPFYGCDYGDCPIGCGAERWDCQHMPEAVLSVHGGITFSGPCQEDREHGICHTPDAGEPTEVWWLGWDTAHAGDSCPAMPGIPGDVYRTLAYVQEECARLARQLCNIGGKRNSY